MFLPLFDVICDLLLNRRTATWNLFVLCNREKSCQWWRHLCVCPLIDHSYEPIKMRIEFSILYKLSSPVSSLVSLQASVSLCTPFLILVHFMFRAAYPECQRFMFFSGRKRNLQSCVSVAKARQWGAMPMQFISKDLWGQRMRHELIFRLNKATHLQENSVLSKFSMRLKAVSDNQLWIQASRFEGTLKTYIWNTALVWTTIVRNFSVEHLPFSISIRGFKWI